VEADAVRLSNARKTDVCSSLMDDKGHQIDNRRTRARLVSIAVADIVH